MFLKIWYSYEKTVIVVGAGARAEFGLPVGNQHQDAIFALAKLDMWEGHTSTNSYNDAYLKAVTNGKSASQIADAHRK